MNLTKCISDDIELYNRSRLLVFLEPKRKYPDGRKNHTVIGYMERTSEIINEVIESNKLNFFNGGVDL